MMDMLPIYSSPAFDFNELGYNPPIQPPRKGREIFSDVTIDAARAGALCSGALAVTLLGRLVPALGIASILLRLATTAYCLDDRGLSWVDAVAVLAGSICGDWDIVIPVWQILGEFIASVTLPLSIGAIAIFAILVAIKYAN